MGDNYAPLCEFPLVAIIRVAELFFPDTFSYLKINLLSFFLISQRRWLFFCFFFFLLTEFASPTSRWNMHHVERRILVIFQLLRTWHVFFVMHVRTDRDSLTGMQIIYVRAYPRALLFADHSLNSKKKKEELHDLCISCCARSTFFFFFWFNRCFRARRS